MFDVATLARILFEQFALPGDAHFAVAYSGGRDSQVLLHALSAAQKQFAPRFGFGITALHFDHALAPQSADWARHCQTQCQGLGVAFVTTRQPVQKTNAASLEAQARASRYRWFAQVLKPSQILLTAHHADDQAETVLLNLLRGGSVHALAAIPPRRPLNAASGSEVVRPLLEISGADLGAYAATHKLTWIEDPANAELAFDRNYLRHQIIPQLTRRWPSAVLALGQSAQHNHRVAQWLDARCDAILAQCQVVAKRGVFCLADPLSTDALANHQEFQVIAALRRWLHRHGCGSPSNKQLQMLYRTVFAAAHASGRVAWQKWQVRYFQRHLYLIPKLSPPPQIPRAWNVVDCDLGSNGVAVRVDSLPSQHPLRVAHSSGRAVRLAWRRGGERMTLPKRRHSSAVKKLFQHYAVPPWERDALPLIWVDEKVAWAHRVGLSAEYCDDPDAAQIGIGFHAASV